MAEQFILIPGRTSRQGTTLNEGKYTDGYLDETQTLQVNPDDMHRLGLAEGERVRMWNDVGEVTVPIKASKGDELPPGMLFISYGDISSRLMGLDTHGSGMPDSKGLDVWLEPLPQNRRPP
jgi:formylmethanofuran dehydrogenase subunit D